MPKLKWVTTKYVFDVTDMPALRNHDGRRFKPENAVITHRSDLGFNLLRVQGYKLGADGWSTAVSWDIQGDQVVVELGEPRAPAWLHELVAQAVGMHAEPEVQAQAQATGSDLCRCAWLGVGTPEHARSGLCRPEVSSA